MSIESPYTRSTVKEMMKFLHLLRNRFDHTPKNMDMRTKKSQVTIMINAVTHVHNIGIMR